MSGTFQGVSMMSAALSAFQQELDVTGNNVANVNTPGYSRQVVNLTSVADYGTVNGASANLGNGVSVSSVTRMQDLFLQQQLQSSNGESGRLSTMQNGLNSVQSLTLEPGATGVSSALSAFYSAWSAYGSNPGDASSQQAVLSAGQTLTDRVRSLYGNLQTQKDQIGTDITSTVSSIQSDINQIGDLNTKIRMADTTGQPPNQLLDQRDQVIQDLSGLVDVQTTPNADGSVNVSMNGLTLVNQQGAKTFPANYNTTSSTVTDSNGISYPVRTGKLAGQFGLSTAIVGYQSQLSTFANTMRTQVNNLYGTAKNSAGATGMKFFNDSNPQTGAIDFNLDPTTAANPAGLAGGTSGNAGDGGVANSISQLATTNIPALGNVSTTQYYANFISSIGSQSKYYTTASATQGALQTQITNQIQSVSGVSTDEEMTNMLRFQRSYQAASQALAIFDTCTSELLTMMQGH